MTAQEVRAQLKLMKDRKAADSQGIVAEMLKNSEDGALDLIAHLFTDVLKADMEAPSQWSRTIMQVLFKKGDPKLAENYRPISALPIIYKLFSKVVLARMRQGLESEQSCDQAGFRSTFACEDHLFAISMLAEKHLEWQRPLWVVTVDFKKAFDTIGHTCLWKALLEQGAAPLYVDVFRRLYQMQTAVVKCDRESKAFDVQRGTKQGDPISPTFFNAALEKVMRELKRKWSSERRGIDVDGDSLTNLRFADDVLLVCKSLREATVMLDDLRREAARVGLEVHFDKTKILSNGIGHGQLQKSVDIGGQPVEVVPAKEGAMYLGKLMALVEGHEVELQHRITRGWRKFMTFKKDLCDRTFPIDQRFRLFNAVVTPTVLYGCGTWAMTTTRERALKTAQRRMLRMMLGRPRQTRTAQASESSSERSEEEVEMAEDELEVESWVAWVRRVIAEAELVMSRLEIPDWVTEQRRRKWSWAGHIARRTDGRWTRKILEYQPEGTRAQRRPFTRWETSLDAFIWRSFGHDNAAGSWKELAHDSDSWRLMTDAFANCTDNE